MDEMNKTNALGADGKTAPRGKMNRFVKLAIIIVIAAAVVVGAVFGGISYIGRSRAIDKSQALSIAVKDSGTVEPVVSKCHFGLEDGMFCYEIELRSDGREYEYTIHAETGTILERDIDGTDRDHHD